jgi:hypothetical protein
MTTQTRRDFHAKMIGGLMTYGLLELLGGRRLFASSVQPIIGPWLKEMNDLGRDLKGQKLKDVDFQTKLEALFRRVELPDLLKAIDFDRLASSVKFPQQGAATIGLQLTNIEGTPSPLVFGRQIFACQKGRSIVPHGHDNMSTGFIVLKGSFQGRHYDRVEDHKEHYLIQPTLDRTFAPGEPSTISDNKDNVHWFTATTETAFIFNVHFTGYNVQSKKSPRRVYVDPQGEKTASGLIVAKKISSAECHKKYG